MHLPLRLAPLFVVSLLSTGCSDCGFEERVPGTPRPLETVALAQGEVIFSVELVDDHLGWGVTYTAGGRGALPNGIRWPEDDWRARPSISASRGGEPLEMVETHNREWYRIGDGYESADEAQEVADSMQVEHCERGDLLVYRYLGRNYASRWKIVELSERGATHGRAAALDAPSCTAALTIQEELQR